MALMSLREYAKHQNVSVASIRKRMATGKIPKSCLKNQVGKVHPLIDSEQADKAWAMNKNVAQALAIQAKKEKQKEKPSLAPITKKVEDMSAQGGSPEQEIDVLNFDSDVNRYTKAKTSTEELRSRKLELEVLEKEGALLNAEEVRTKISKLVNETKEAILNVPSKIGPELLGCTDLIDLEVRLTKALNEALFNLSRLEGTTNG